MLPEGVDANRQAIPETIAFQSRNTRLHFHPSSRRIVADGSVCWTSARRDTKEQATAMAWTTSTRDGLLRPLASGSYGGWMAWRQAAVRVRVVGGWLFTGPSSSYRAGRQHDSLRASGC